MYNFIVNPATGRKVSINYKLGKEILQKYIRLIGGSSSSNPESSRQGAVRTKALKIGKKRVEIDMENLMSKIPLNLWEHIVKTNNYNEIIGIVDKLRKVNKDFHEYFTFDKCMQLVTEVRRNYLLQLVKDNKARMLDDNTILQTVDFDPNEWIEGETVVEFLNEEMLQERLEDTNYITEEVINRVMEIRIFLFVDMQPSRRGFTGTLEFVEPIVREDGELDNIVLDGVEHHYIQITGRLLKLDIE